MVYLTHLVLDGLEFIPGFDTGQGWSPDFGGGADVLSLAGAVALGGVNEVEVTGLALAVFAPVGSSQDGLEPSSSLSSKLCGTGK